MPTSTFLLDYNKCKMEKDRCVLDLGPNRVAKLLIAKGKTVTKWLHKAALLQPVGKGLRR